MSDDHDATAPDSRWKERDMTDKGRAAFNARHLRHGTGHDKGTSGTTGDRQRLLEEMMRELEEKWAKHHATKNPNIVLDETHLNESFMFDPDTGGWRTPESVDEVVAYGDDRAAQVGRKIGATSFETTTLVVHLPRTLCTEVPGYYPVHDEDGQIKLDKDGNELRRSRWVARDRAEANRYLIAATEWLADNVLPGGREAVHGFNVQHDESTPHVQIMADTFAEHPDKPGVLRVEASQAWGSHRDVRYPEDHPQAGQQMGGPQKMRMYQQGLREYMRSLGYEVELEVSERAHESLDKDRYAAEDDARRVLAADREALEAALEKYSADAQLLGTAQKNFDGDVTAFQADLEEFRAVAARVDARERDILTFAEKLEEVEKDLQDREGAVANREKAVEAGEAALPGLTRKARAEGYETGKAEGLQAAQEAAEKAAAKIRAQAVVDAQRLAQQASEAAQRVRRDAEVEAEQKRQQADRDAAATLSEAHRIRAYAEAERRSADTTRIEAADTLLEAQQVLRSAQEVEPPQINEIDYRREMNTVDADFLEKLCEKHPKIADSLERYRDQRRRQVQWGTPQQRAALDRTVGQAQELAEKRFGLRPDGLKGPQAGRQHGNEPEHRSGPSGL